MAEKRPIITIEVDDTAFENFKRKFEAFKQGAGINVLASGAAGMFRASDIPGMSLVRGIETLSARILTLTRTMTSFGLRIASGEVLGIGMLGYSAFFRYREATGLGVTPGQLSAFAAYYSPLVSGKDVLSRVANARNDLSMRPYLARLGVGQGELASQSNDQIAVSIVERAAQLWKNGPQTTQFAEAMGLTQFFSMEDLRRMGQMTPEQLRRMHGQMNAAEGQLNFSPEIAQQWNDLTVQLRKAGVQIDTVLIKDLSRLAQPLAHLSDVIVNTLDSFLNNADMPGEIDKLGHGIEWVASEIASGDFQAGVKTFAGNIVIAAEGLANFAKMMGLVSETMPGNTAEDLRRRLASGDSRPNEWYDLQARARDLMIGSEDYLSGYDLITGRGHAISGYTKHAQQVQDLEKKYNLPAGSLFGVWGAESQFSKITRASAAGAVGPFQLMPQNYRGAGINPNDFEAAAQEAATEYAAYLKKYRDEDKALAAYNWGPANLDKDIAKYGKAWNMHLPDETTGFIDRVRGYQPQAPNALNKPPVNPRVSLTVHNSTSANVATTAAALSH